jgi:hypothetical protein
MEDNSRYNGDEDFSRKSKSYRKHHMDAVKALYGNEQPPTIKPRRKPKDKRKINPPGESGLQIKLVQWAKLKGLDLISIPNHGKRSFRTGQREVAMGLTRGVSDLYLAHTNDIYAGFWIELKTKGKTPTFDQCAWMHKMRKNGYMAEWYDDFDKAKEAIEEYLYGIIPAA